jgi:hypothetical protein
MKLRLKDTPKETIDRAGTRTVTGVTFENKELILKYDKPGIVYENRESQ